MKHCVQALPPGYRQRFVLDLVRNKKAAWLVNGLGLLIGVVLAVLGALHTPIALLFDMSRGLGPYALRFGAIIVGSFAYIVLHELVHGITMKLFGAQKVKYGYKGVYAYAGSEEYFAKWPYLVVALAPVVLWGAVFAVLCAAVPEEWFWVIWLLQISNLSGAAGDLYVTVRFLRLPPDILVQDVGVSMTVFEKE